MEFKGKTDVFLELVDWNRVGSRKPKSCSLRVGEGDKSKKTCSNYRQKAYAENILWKQKRLFNEKWSEGLPIWQLPTLQLPTRQFPTQYTCNWKYQSLCLKSIAENFLLAIECTRAFVSILLQAIAHLINKYLTFKVGRLLQTWFLLLTCIALNFY